ncbi:MAG: ATPase, T2SS/T4P/T4SS family [Promethearchaeota archaeon]
MIEEIFIDEIETPLYINHQRYGRLESDLMLSNVEIEAIKTYVCLESKKRLDLEHPNVMHVFQSKYFYARFSVDIYPSHWKNIAIDIRNLKKKTLTLLDLVNLKTLNIEIASFILFSVYFRINITIVGEVNSGKTTLLNAIDMYAPSHFRKIYVEENIETLGKINNLSHQLKYIVKPEALEKDSKQKQIYKLLHRSGDFIILGEILSNLETHAMFHCLSAGLKGLQTTHASSINGLINRWIFHYNINQSCLNDLGIIILMKRTNHQRFIHSIYQIVYIPVLKEIKILKLFNFDFQEHRWKKNALQIQEFLDNKYKNIFILKRNQLQSILDKIKEVIIELNNNKKFNFFQIDQLYRNINTFISEI